MSALTLPSPPRESLDLYAPVAADLEAMEGILHKSLSGARPGVAELMGYLDNYRGKRLRPTLLLLTARACGQVNPAHHVLAAVVEMIHTATLVHDDVLDEATVRRHAPTINASWGNQASILLGDYLFTHAFHLTSTLGQARACQVIGEATNRLCAGELHQVCQRGNLNLSEEEYFDIIDGKTAELTSCCCRLGAMYSLASHDMIERLARYGRYLGLAFQITDDLLDLVGEERSAGKSLGTDLEQRKMTLPLIRLLRQTSPEESGLLRQLLVNSSNHKRELLLPHLEASGALAYARNQAEQYAAQAEKELVSLPASTCKTVLQRIARQVVDRTC